MAFRSLETIFETGTFDEVLAQAAFGGVFGALVGSPIGLLAMFGLAYLTKNWKWGLRAYFAVLAATMASGAGIGFFSEVPVK